MTENTTPDRRRYWPRRVRYLALFTAALGIAAAIMVSNATRSLTCPARPDAAAALDSAATGELAALLPTASGRAWSDLGFVNEKAEPSTIAAFSGRPLLVNFWATWCVPCREEMPALNKLAQTYDQKDFTIVPVNLDLGDGGIEKATAFLKQENLADLALYADPTYKAFERLKTNGVAIGLPATLLLDANGCELAVLQGPAKWDSADGKAVIDALIRVARN